MQRRVKMFENANSIDMSHLGIPGRVACGTSRGLQAAANTVSCRALPSLTTLFVRQGHMALHKAQTENNASVVTYDSCPRNMCRRVARHICAVLRGSLFPRKGAVQASHVKLMLEVKMRPSPM